MLKKYLLLFLIPTIGLYLMTVQAEPIKTPPQAAIASAHPLATEAGKQILLQGGNAFDAAAALVVVEPYSSGLGGGGFWLIRDAGKNKTIMLDGRETALAKATQDMYLDSTGNYIPNSSVNGPLAAGIPGTVAAIVHLSEQYGVLPLEQFLQPAIHYAEQGFSVTEHYQKMAQFRLSVLQSYPESARIFLHNNQVPEIGYKIVQTDLAKTLKQIARTGGKDFYQGFTAIKMVNAVKKTKGIWQLDDLKNYRLKERQPITFAYRDMQIISAAPPSSGGIALAGILQILQNYNLQSMKQAQQVHLTVEAMRRAYRDRAEYLGDSDFVKVPVKRLTHPFYAQGLAAGIRLDKDSLSGIIKAPEGQDTTHFSIIDT